MSRFQTRSGERLHWRALVRTSGALETARAAHGLSWHLVECADPAQPEAHCPVGVDMLSTGGDPDGHCLVNGACPRCALANAPVPPASTPLAVTPVPADPPLGRAPDSPAESPVPPGVS
jgi:hypothetical protein